MKAGLKHGHKSGLEQSIQKQIVTVEGKPTVYEDHNDMITYEVHEIKKYYRDFRLANGIIIETKGRFMTADRKKHLLIKKQHPDLDVRFVFSNPNQKLYKGAKSTAAQWCEKYGFKYAKKSIPEEWFNENKSNK